MQRSTAPRSALWLALAATTLAGCTTVGPNFHAPAAPTAAGYTRQALPAQTASAPGTAGGTQQFAAAAVSPDWWTEFHSKPLDALIDRALQNNPSLAAAQASLRQAQQTYAAQAGSTLYPTVDAKFGASRNQSNAAGLGQSSNASNTYNLYNASVAVGYNLDLFGGNRRALEALAAQVDYQRYQLDAARLALAGNIATAAFTRRSCARSSLRPNRSSRHSRPSSRSRASASPSARRHAPTC